MAKFVENVFFDFSPYIRKKSHSCGGAWGLETAVENVFLDFSNLHEKKEKSFMLQEVYQRFTRKKNSIKVQ